MEGTRGVLIIAAAIGLVAVAAPADAQVRGPESPGAVAVGLAAGPAIFSREGTAVEGFGPSISAEITVAPTYFIRAQYATAPRHRFTLGLAQSRAVLERRAYLSVEGGFVACDRRNGVYGGGGLQLPWRGSPLVFTGDARLYLTEIDVGVAVYAGIKVHLR